MPRPKSTEANARQRLCDSFWEMLEEGEPGGINIRRLSRRAGVNHNTFYYHFSSIEDMEKHLIDETVPEELAPLVAVLHHQNRLKIDNIPFPDDILTRAGRLKSILKNGSPSLRDSLQSKIFAIWLGVTGRKEESLTQKERIELTFLINGFMGAFAELDLPQDLPIIEQIANGALGKGYFGTIQGLARSQEQPSTP